MVDSLRLCWFVVCGLDSAGLLRSCSSFILAVRFEGKEGEWCGPSYWSVRGAGIRLNRLFFRNVPRGSRIISDGRLDTYDARIYRWWPLRMLAYLMTCTPHPLM